VRGCNLPSDYRSRGVSQMAVFAESGYRANRSAVGIEAIRKYIAENPGLVGDWMGYSEDKRSGGWYFAPGSIEGFFIVGGSRETEQKYSDRFEACAVFIKHELERMASYEERVAKLYDKNPR
jgi:hypothetical protein